MLLVRLNGRVCMLLCIVPGGPELIMVSADVGYPKVSICLIFIIVYKTKLHSLADSGIVW